MNEPNRSPLKDKPLRQAGQSLDEERHKLFEDKLEVPLLLALVYCVFAGLEWGRYVFNVKPQPALVTAVAAMAVAFGAWRFFRVRPKMRALRLGLEGEKVVGRYLEGLRAKGYTVFHDIVAPGFNIDHVLIGPAGVFTIETKTWSKPTRGDARITFDGERLLAAGREPDRNPIVQAQAQASWLKNLLAESTGQPVAVWPVVLFPGWFIEQSPGSLQRLWVLEPKALPSFLEREAVRLAPADAKLAAFHLSRFIRSVERDRAASA